MELVPVAWVCCEAFTPNLLQKIFSVVKNICHTFPHLRAPLGEWAMA